MGAGTTHVENFGYVAQVNSNGDVVASPTTTQLPASLGSKPAADSLSVAPASQAAAAWATGATPQDVRNYSEAELQVSGLSGGDTIAVTRSIDGANYAAISGIGQDFAVVAIISADGIYSYRGGGYLKYTRTGAVSTPSVTLRASN